jgi:alkylation response protein AidB-like acyl-CoA dehydrogenase
MQFGLTETQQTLKGAVRKFLAAECPIADVRKLMETDTAFDAALWTKMTEQGWPGIIFPEQYGGFGMGAVELAVAFEEMGRALLPGPLLSVITAGAVIEGAGDEGQKSKYVGAICRGERASLALLEDNASWKPEAVAMRATPSAHGYSLYGRKMFVPDAGVASFLVCAARLGSDLALFIVPSSSSGLTVTRTPAMDETRKLYALEFDAVSIPSENLLAQGARAQQALETGLDLAAIALVAEMTGGMQRLLEITVEYAKTRKQFGKPIGSFQAVQHQCADMLVMTESSRSAAYYAGWAMTEGIPEAAAAVSVAKAYASESYREVE